MVRLDRTAARSDQSGFTLIEMLVVMSLLSVLIGLGVGMLNRRGSDFDIARTVVRDQVRLARETALARHVPTEVVFSGDGFETLITVESKSLEPVAHWHMEGRPGLDRAPRESRIEGDVVQGRIGEARRTEVDPAKTLLRLPIGRRPSFDLSGGFAVRLDVLIEERSESTVFRIGNSIEWTLDEDLFLSVRVVPSEGGGAPAAPVQIEAEEPLRLGRWHALDLVHDGRRLTMRVDDRTIATAPMTLSLLQLGSDELFVSPEDRPLVGIVDSVQLWGFTIGDRQAIPGTLEFDGARPVVRFDDRGQIERADPIRFTNGDETIELRVTPTGAIE